MSRRVRREEASVGFYDYTIVFVTILRQALGCKMRGRNEQKQQGTRVNRRLQEFSGDPDHDWVCARKGLNLMFPE